MNTEVKKAKQLYRILLARLITYHACERLRKVYIKYHVCKRPHEGLFYRYILSTNLDLFSIILF